MQLLRTLVLRSSWKGLCKERRPDHPWRPPTKAGNVSSPESGSTHSDYDSDYGRHAYVLLRRRRRPSRAVTWNGVTSVTSTGRENYVVSFPELHLGRSDGGQAVTTLSPDLVE
eukprot:Polyplicarium_translucidae@DN2123_c0_g1_i1.p2